jgi:leucine dehydrogenase
MQRNSNDSSAADLKFEEIFVPGYKKVIRVTSDQANLNAIICIHSTVLGPALGGARIYPYETFEEALRDALRLAKSMTYKAAVAGCNLGGGKSVIIADFKKNKTKEMLLAFGHAVDRLQGQYICATDVGCTQADISVIRQVTPYVVGLSDQKSSGNPTPFTAWGTYRGIQSVLKKIYGTDSPENKTIAIQGLGNVGSKLAELLGRSAFDCF